MHAILQWRVAKATTWVNQKERRYDLDEERSEQALAILARNLPATQYSPGSVTTLVATLYFDTPDRAYLRGARGGQASSKVRLREYFPLSDDTVQRVLDVSDRCYLEHKQRRGKTRDKHRVELTKSRVAAVLDGGKGLPVEVVSLRREIERRQLEPVLVSMYERRVWSGNSDLRVTFDEHLRFYDAPARLYEDVPSLHPSHLGEQVALGSRRILEIKHRHDVELPVFLTELLASLCEAEGFSKYLEGMAAIAARPKDD